MPGYLYGSAVDWRKWYAITEPEEIEKGEKVYWGEMVRGKDIPMLVEVVVVDVRVNRGETQYCIKPTAGDGFRWVAYWTCWLPQ